MISLAIESSCDETSVAILEDGRTVVRFASSWATLEEDVDELLEILGQVSRNV